MIPSLHLDLPEQEAAKEFASARKKALLRRIGTFLRRRPSSNRLLSLDVATEVLGPWRQAYLGRRTVPVKSIVGSEGRYADFDDEFLPLQGSSEEKWRSVYAALRRGEGLPPVSLLKVGDAYFVRDGNHRVSVARWLGIAALDADVAEVRRGPDRDRDLRPRPSGVPLAPASTRGSAVRAACRRWRTKRPIGAGAS